MRIHIRFIFSSTNSFIECVVCISKFAFARSKNDMHITNCLRRSPRAVLWRHLGAQRQHSIFQSSVAACVAAVRILCPSEEQSSQPAKQTPTKITTVHFGPVSVHSQAVLGHFRRVPNSVASGLLPSLPRLVLVPWESLPHTKNERQTKPKPPMKMRACCTHSSASGCARRGSAGFSKGQSPREWQWPMLCARSLETW